MSLKAECTDECDEEDEKRISRSHHEGGMKKTTRPSCLDEDEQLPPFVSTIYRSISGQIRHVYVQLNSICMNMAQNHFEPNGHIAANSESTLTPRKVRPITQVPAADLKQQRIQKQLRQWFWWRYGSEKDLIDALNSYIREQLLLPQFPVMTTDRNQVFWLIISLCANFSSLECSDVFSNVSRVNLQNFTRSDATLLEGAP